MPLGPASRKMEPLRVIPMAIALVLAAFAGAALGLIWQSAGLAESDEVADVEAQTGAPGE